MRKLAIIFGGAALLVACENNPPPPPLVTPAVVDPTDPLFAPGFLAKAASGDLFEIQSSQMALQMSANPAVRNYANLLIAEHTRMSQATMAAARSAGDRPAAAGNPARAAGGARPVSAAGPNFDVAFRDAQIHRSPGRARADAELCRQRRRAGAAHRCPTAYPGDPDAPCPGAGAPGRPGCHAAAADAAAEYRRTRRVRAIRPPEAPPRPCGR